MSVKLTFNVKFGENTIEIPVNTGESLYSDNGSGLSNLNDKTFTLINQIPTSAIVSTKIAWTKHIIDGCAKVDGIYDKSTGTMVYKANTFTAYLSKWQNYREPNFSDNGYYSLYGTDEKLYTATVGDLIIFREIDDPAPTTAQEFNNLRTKYANEGGVLTSVETFISYRSNGTPWRTNHIELTKG